MKRLLYLQSKLGHLRPSSVKLIKVRVVIILIIWLFLLIIFFRLSWGLVLLLFWSIFLFCYFQRDTAAGLWHWFNYLFLLLEQLLSPLFDGLLVGFGEITFIIPGNKGLFLIGWIVLDLVKPFFLLLLFWLLKLSLLFKINFLQSGRLLLSFFLFLNFSWSFFGFWDWFFLNFTLLNCESFWCLLSLFLSLIFACFLFSGLLYHLLESFVVLPMFFVFFLLDTISFFTLLIETTSGESLSKGTVFIKYWAVIKVLESG